LRQWIEKSHEADLRYIRQSTMSEDFAFCKKAPRHGYSIWCDLSLSHEIAHIGEQSVTFNHWQT
jgi:hypothetical protein